MWRVSACVRACVCVCVCGGGGGGEVRGIQYYVYVLFLRFMCTFFAHLIKRGMLTLVGKHSGYRNDCHFSSSSSSNLCAIVYI